MTDYAILLDGVLKLQDAYVKAIENDNGGGGSYKEIIAEYTHVLDTIKSRREFAKSVLVHRLLPKTLRPINATLYMPVLSMVQVMLKGHDQLVATLSKEVPELLSDVLDELVTHLMLATDSIAVYYQSRSTGQLHCSVEVVYSPDEALTIIDITSKLIQNAVKGGRDLVVVETLNKLCPDLTETLSKCSTYTNLTELFKLAVLFMETRDKRQAAVVFQAAWRGILARRKWNAMRRGFRALQLLFRKRLVKSNDIIEVRLREQREERMRQEAIYQRLEKTPSFNFFSRIPPPPSPPVPSDNVNVGRQDLEKQRKIESDAALTIQYVVRRWLTNKANAALTSSWNKSLLEQPHHRITEERAASLQRDIESWQRKNPLLPMSHDELLELGKVAQFRFEKYQRHAASRRLAEHRLNATVAQTGAIISMLTDDLPPLDQYESRRDFRKFHSLPLHVATKARLDHNLALDRLQRTKRWPEC